MTEQEFKNRYFNLIGDAYRFMHSHMSSSTDEEYWGCIKKESDELYKKHGKTLFSKELIVVILWELERIARGETEV